MKNKNGITLTMLVIYVIIITIIMGAVILNLGYNNEIDELDKATYQAKILDYMEQFTTMKNFYTLKGEYNDEIIIRENEKDIYGRSINDYIGSITMEDRKYLCIYNGELHTYGMKEEDTRYQYIQELGITQIEYIQIPDNTAPVIAITPNGINMANVIQVTISASDNKGLSAANTYEYYLSTSSETTTGGSWKEYKNGTTFSIGEGLTETYYIHVKPVYDREGNSSGTFISQAYTFDNKKPTANAVIAKVSEGVYTATMSISDDKDLDFTKCAYVLSESNANLGTNIDNYDNVFGTNSKTVKFGICGNFYLHVLATDTVGNTKEYVSEKLESTNIDYGILGNVKDFTFKGEYERYVIPRNGVYKLECWGGQGGSTDNTGGKGAYTLGFVNLNANTSIYAYVGGMANTFNGGGQVVNAGATYNPNGYGGGATDFRLSVSTDYLWSELNSLRSRIMVAAGGGANSSAVNGSAAGIGGTLTGGNGSPHSSCAGYNASGASQTAGGARHTSTSALTSYGTAGTFGVGGSSGIYNDGHQGGAGGGGYYGGGGAAWHAGGGGGSSFISGYSGCNALDTNGNHTGQSVHYSGLSFSNTVMTAGTNTGNGKAKITQYISNYQYIQ